MLKIQLPMRSPEVKLRHVKETKMTEGPPSRSTWPNITDAIGRLTAGDVVTPLRFLPRS